MISNLPRIFVFALILTGLSAISHAARILGIIPVPSYSHQVPARALWKTLLQRGHEVVVLTTDPLRDPTLKNLTEIDLSDTYVHVKNLELTKRRFMTTTWMDVMDDLCNVGFILSKSIYEHPAVRKMYEKGSKQKFDVVIAETLFTPATYALAHRLNAPLIGYSSITLMSHNLYTMGAPMTPSHPSVWEMEHRVDFNLNFWQRLRNFVTLHSSIYNVIIGCYERQQKLVEEFLGPNVPHIADLEKQISLIFVTEEHAISFAKPQLPNQVSIGGIHVPTELPPLPKDVKRFIENAREGFIYVSFGTNVAIKSFPPHVRKIFRDVFAKLPYKILWKTDDQTVGENLDNVYTSSWFPQCSILGHPNIKLFVYQGGLQSTEEAIYSGVPLLGFPMIADQHYQVKKMAGIGVARSYEILNITEDSLYSAILEMINNRTYKDNAIKLQNLVKDKPYDTREMAAWWVEFIIRHKGANHLRNTIAFDPWYQRYDMDVIAFISIVTFILLSFLLLIIYKVLNYFSRQSFVTAIKANNKTKMN